MKALKSTLKSTLIYLLIASLNIAYALADFLPAQPGDPGLEGMSVPIDGGILMGLLAASSIISLLFKKKKKEE